MSKKSSGTSSGCSDPGVAATTHTAALSTMKSARQREPTAPHAPHPPPAASTSFFKDTSPFQGQRREATTTLLPEQLEDDERFHNVERGMLETLTIEENQKIRLQHLRIVRDFAARRQAGDKRLPQPQTLSSMLWECFMRLPEKQRNARWKNQGRNLQPRFEGYYVNYMPAILEEPHVGNCDACGCNNLVVRAGQGGFGGKRPEKDAGGKRAAKDKEGNVLQRISFCGHCASFYPLHKAPRLFRLEAENERFMWYVPTTTSTPTPMSTTTPTSTPTPMSTTTPTSTPTPMSTTTPSISTLTPTPTRRSGGGDVQAGGAGGGETSSSLSGEGKELQAGLQRWTLEIGMTHAAEIDQRQDAVLRQKEANTAQKEKRLAREAAARKTEHTTAERRTTTQAQAKTSKTSTSGKKDTTKATIRNASLYVRMVHVSSTSRVIQWYALGHHNDIALLEALWRANLSLLRQAGVSSPSITGTLFEGHTVEARQQAEGQMRADGLLTPPTMKVQDLLRDKAWSFGEFKCTPTPEKSVLQIIAQASRDLQQRRKPKWMQEMQRRYDQETIALCLRTGR
jgi:hypothetical protein